jgi:hypothetical protein
LRSLGEHRLKDIDDPVVLHQLVIEGLRSDFPPLRTPSASHPTNLPPRLPSLLGRDVELSTIQDLLASPEVSVVTLVGSGGTGKTTLATAVGAELLSSFPDGVFFVDLSAVTDSSLVVPALAQALSLRETPGRSLRVTLSEHLSSKEMLLILYNFEQVIDAAPEVSSLLKAAPVLKVLVTSREALRVQGEKEFPVAPLTLPSSSDDPEAVAHSPAVALFVLRAQDVRPDFHPSPSRSLQTSADVWTDSPWRSSSLLRAPSCCLFLRSMSDWRRASRSFRQGGETPLSGSAPSEVRSPGATASSPQPSRWCSAD